MTSRWAILVSLCILGAAGCGRSTVLGNTATDGGGQDQGLQPGPTWVRSGGGAGMDHGYGVAVDPVGNAYITGSFSVAASFGPKVLTSQGSSDVFVLKLNPSGDILWAVSAGGRLGDYGSGIAVDHRGGVLVTGFFFDRASFGSSTLNAAGKEDIFVARLDASGAFSWAVSAGGNLGEYHSSIAADPVIGGCTIAGTFSGQAFFGGQGLTSAGKEDIFVARLNQAGVFQWAVQGGGKSADYGHGIAINSAGTNYLTGSFADQASFGSFSLKSSGQEDAFVAVLDQGGKVIRAVKGGGARSDRGRSIAVDRQGFVTILGLFQDQAGFDGIKVKSAGREDLFIARWNPSDKFIWVRSAGGPSDETAGGIASDAAGNSLITGSFQGSAVLGAGSLTSSGGRDVMAVRLDSTGKFLWSASGGGSAEDLGHAAALNFAGQGFVVGSFVGQAKFSSTTLTSRGIYDGFVWKLEH